MRSKSGKKTVRNDSSAKKRSKGQKVAKAVSKKISKEGTYNGVFYESGIELFFLYWAFTLKKEGYISSIKRSDSYLLLDAVVNNYSQQLKRSSKPMQQTILQGHSYTPDFTIYFTKKAIGKFVWILNSGVKKEDGLMVGHPDLDDKSVCYVEAKADFDKNGSTAKAVNSMKFTFFKHGHFINLFRPNDWFAKTFTPMEYMYTQRGTKRLLRYPVRTLGEYLNSLS